MKLFYSALVFLAILLESAGYAVTYDVWRDSQQAVARVITVDPAFEQIRIVVDSEGMITRPCEMAEQYGAVAAINGGFFAFPDGTEDDGLKSRLKRESVADGNLITPDFTHALSRDALPTFVWSHRGQSVIQNLSQSEPGLPSWAQFAINAMPVLLRNGKVPEWDQATLEAVLGEYELPRTGLCMGLDGRFRLFALSEATIGQMGDLAQVIRCKDAINLDGGPSTSLVYEGKSLMHRSCFNERPVHNSIIITELHK